MLASELSAILQKHPEREVVFRLRMWDGSGWRVETIPVLRAVERDLGQELGTRVCLSFDVIE